jgi:hypothetical protein
VIQREQKHSITPIFDFHANLEINKENQNKTRRNFFMNMKKSIAGVMAGAMAVSAMATAVSADQDAISLTYDLKTYVYDSSSTDAKVTVVANYEGSLITADSITNGFISFGVDNGFVTGDDIYNEYGVKIGSGNQATMVDFEFTARPYKDLVNDVEEKYQTFKATNDASSTDGAYYDPYVDTSYWNGSAWAMCNTGLGGRVYKMPISTTGSANAFDLRKYDLYNLGYSVAENAASAGLATATTSTYAVRDAVAKMTYKVPNTVNLNQANVWSFSADDAETIAGLLGESLYDDVTMTAEKFAWGFYTNTKGVKKGVISKDYEAVDNNTNGNDRTTYTMNTTLASAPTSVSVGAFTSGEASEKVYPFKSTLTPSGSENNVITALTSRKAGGNYYTKPVAVLNDAIANHDNVVFTFTSYSGYVGTTKSHLQNEWVEVDRGYDYQTSSFDWHNPTFGQQLYTNLADAYSLFDTSDYDNYGSYSSAWGINLFTGAVVVNSELTMQLSDTDTFSWGSNTLSFDWFDITDEGKITDAKTFLKSMLLYTPTDWYWDTLTVVVSDDEDEDIDAGEGLDGEGDVIEDEEPDVVEEEPAVVEEVAEPEVVETEAAPVQTAPSPATGNAPVALAVIPVALAAAAVVAKKRG